MVDISDELSRASKSLILTEAFYGLFLMSKRILNCHPWGRSGYDPVP